MKKRKALFFILTAVLISSLLIFFPAADGGKPEISEDYGSISYGGNTYVPFLDSFYSEETDFIDGKDSFNLTSEQKNQISSITADIYGDAGICLNIHFKKGGHSFNYYINTDFLDDYEAFEKNGGSIYCFVDGNTFESVTVEPSKLFAGPTVTFKSYELNYYDTYATVTTKSEDGHFGAYSGDIIYDGNGNYYYYNALAPEEGDSVTLYKLDPSIFPKTNESDLEFTATVVGLSGAVLSLLLGALPIAALVLCIILLKKAKQPYRRGLITITVLLGVELVAFAVSAILLLIK